MLQRKKGGAVLVLTYLARGRKWASKGGGEEGGIIPDLAVTVAKKCRMRCHLPCDICNDRILKLCETLCCLIDSSLAASPTIVGVPMPVPQPVPPLQMMLSSLSLCKVSCRAASLSWFERFQFVSSTPPYPTGPKLAPSEQERFQFCVGHLEF